MSNVQTDKEQCSGEQERFGTYLSMYECVVVVASVCFGFSYSQRRSCRYMKAHAKRRRG